MRHPGRGLLHRRTGRERTRADFEQLCERAGFTVTEIHPLPAPAVFSLIEATPSGNP